MVDYYDEAQQGEVRSSLGKMAAPCKRDYEAEINRHKDRLEKQQNALTTIETLLDNHGGAISNLSLKKLMGTAYVNIHELKGTIQMLILEQEAQGG